MPTGYTAKIADGITFEAFAMDCARAFGALIMMRDEPMDAPIPEFQPSEYYLKNLESAKADLTRYTSMSDEGADIEAKREGDEQIAADLKCTEDDSALRKKYEEMLVKVRAWTPPTPDHVEMKSFMVKQIEESIKFDCGLSEYKSFKGYKSGREWKSEKVMGAIKQIQRAEEEYRKEVERTNSRNAWVKALRESLAVN